MNGKGAWLQIRIGTAGCPNDTFLLSTTHEKRLIVLGKQPLNMQRNFPSLSVRT